MGSVKAISHLRQNGHTPNNIGMCSFCWSVKPVCQILLYPVIADPTEVDCPVRYDVTFEKIFKHMLHINFMCLSCEIALRWMPPNIFYDKSTLVQVMAGWCQATSLYLSRCWCWSMLPYGITGSQWVNSLSPSATYMHQWIQSVLVQIMACRLFATKPLSKPMQSYCQLVP